ncbi:Lrp/AsnC family transcriptional regulator [Gulosibacter molinativorax]|uniref:Lrp/AsnC family transcriptional regulator n=1 Tax=Gulosibacter molinativorax TaxID=256821 RepID=A0ABT7C7Y2_9MICO|nr:Lrp/AsnC family transcriptional regulator [Gulosibacter molinativorax]MDJ1371175.1 Lrp/AsnC family transcriptional regulator [Gulosibacter molinativorax]QUY62990.1 AsnC/Lrp family regulatory protein [Gulosibacter molinativorax]
MKPELDEVDRQLIAILQKDGRRSFKEISEETGIPASSVRYRVQRLEESGTLQIVGVADPLRIGFDRLAMIGIKTEMGRARQVCEALAEMPETSYVVLTTGQFDVMVEVVCRDVEHYTELLHDRIARQEGIVGAETFFVLEAYKLAYGWGTGYSHPSSARNGK